MKKEVISNPRSTPTLGFTFKWAEPQRLFMSGVNQLALRTLGSWIQYAKQTSIDYDL